MVSNDDKLHTAVLLPGIHQEPSHLCLNQRPILRTKGVRAVRDEKRPKRLICGNVARWSR